MAENQDRYELQELQEKITSFAEVSEKIKAGIHQNIIGQHEMIDRLLIGLYCNGHILLEGVPGLAKTFTVRTLSQVLDLAFSRIQFTPDLLPADVIGTQIYNQQKADFQVRKGPIFSNLLLADEINRAPAKVQSALLEAMQEKQVTIGNTSYPLPDPFIVIATQNPLEQEGTYPLPEAQQDRFMLKVLVTYPSREEEKQIVQSSIFTNQSTPVMAATQAESLGLGRILCRQVFVEERIQNYILDIIHATRFPELHRLSALSPLISYGASPRASIYLTRAAQAMAMLQKRAFVIPDDVLALAPNVLRHRIGITYEAEAEELHVEYIIGQVLKTVIIP